ncbi:MAG TPA: hypothetical protein VGX23_21990 [Actinocrinis sp.]|nr:hypothetical protein [Actinocrinis sp.]
MSDQWGQPQQQPQNPYGQQPPGPYGQPQQPPPGYGQPQPGQYPGQPQGYPGQPEGYSGQPGFGYPAPVAPQKSKKGLAIGGVVAVIVVIGIVVALVSKSSGGGSQTRAQTCASFATDDAANSALADPTNMGQVVSEGKTEQGQINTLASNAQSGPLKTQLQKFSSDMGNLLTYLQANPSISFDGTGDPPTQLIADGTLLDSDVSAIYATCGLPNPGASGD